MNKARKWIVLTLTLVMLLSLTVTSAGADNNAVAAARNGVVRIAYLYTYDGEDYGQTGSGFCVGEAGKPVEFILTNAHVVTATDSYGNVLGYAEDVYVVFEDIDADSTMKAKVLKVFTDGVDLAVLRLEAPTTLRTSLPLASAGDATIMDKVYALGFPGIADDQSGIIKSTIDDVTITEGAVTKEQYIDSGAKYLQVDAAISSGNSGGPLVDENGNVVGINTLVAMPDAGTSLGYALYIDYATDYLDTMGYPYTKASATVAPEPTDGDVTPAPEPTPVPTPGLPWYIYAGIGAAVLVIALLAVLLVVKNKKQAVSSQPVDFVGGTMPVKPKSEGAYKGRQIVNIGQASALGGKAYPVRGKVVVGRDPAKCQVVFPAKTPGISGVHCAVQEIAEGVVVTDLGSSYGTFLENGTKMEPNKPYTIPNGEAFYLASKDNGFRVK